MSNVISLAPELRGIGRAVEETFREFRQRTEAASAKRDSQFAALANEVLMLRLRVDELESDAAVRAERKVGDWYVPARQ